MAEIDSSQVILSAMASLCAGISLLLWFVLISNGQRSRLVLLHQKPYVFSQAVVGVLVSAGLLGSIALATYQPVLRGGEYRIGFPTPILIMSDECDKTGPPWGDLAVEQYFIVRSSCHLVIPLLCTWDIKTLTRHLQTNWDHSSAETPDQQRKRLVAEFLDLKLIPAECQSVHILFVNSSTPDLPRI